MTPELAAGALAGASVLIFAAGLMAHLASRRWQARLRATVGEYGGSSGVDLNPEGAGTESQPLADRLNRRVRRLGLIPGLKLQLDRAGIRMPPQRFLLVRVALTLIAAGAALLVSGGGGHPRLGILIGAAAGLAGYYSVRPFLAVRRKRRLAAIEDQLPETIDGLAGALESGSSLAQSMALAAREMGEPLASELKRVVRDQELGLNQSQALRRMLDRCPSEDLDMLLTAIDINNRVGGTLSMVLRTISHTIRERLRIRREVRTLTAQGRASAKVVTAVPLGLGGLLFLINREYMLPLFTTTLGRGMFVASVVMTVLGYYIMKRIATVDV